eukprot:4487866-Ditylum_brightwellii.AAC.1
MIFGMTKELVIGVAVLGGMVLGSFLSASNNRNPVSVAFVGNSFQYVNDLPRFLQALSQDRIEYQDSCLHGSLRFQTFLQYGNGMFEKWNTDAAYDFDDGVYDFGSCTVSQLLVGYDDRLSALDNGDDDYYDNDDGNDDDYYIDDEKNPCLQDNDYLLYTLNNKVPVKYDYVVLSDQSMQPAIFEGREESIDVLKNSYAPLLLENGATPVFIMTWAYWREDIDMAEMGLVDVPTFASRLYHGYTQYAKTLAEILPAAQKPRIAPVNLAFLLIHEENYSFWKNNLFGEDNFHPSPSGTYLAGCVIHATIFGQLPIHPPTLDMTIDS